jgi:hypothetical protein
MEASFEVMRVIRGRILAFRFIENIKKTSEKHVWAQV